MLAKASQRQKPGKKKGDLDMEDSEADDDEEDFDLGTALRKMQEPVGSASNIPVSWFAAPPRLSKLLRVSSKLGLQTGFVTTTPLEDWSPSWIGHLETTSSRKAMVTKRRNGFDRASFTQFMGNILSFWLSHMALGQVTQGAVLCHVCLLTKMADEHGTSFAQKYEAHLVMYLGDKQKSAPLHKLDRYLRTVDERILQRLVLSQKTGGPRPPGAPEGPGIPAPRPPRGPDPSKPKGGKEGKGGKDSKGGKDPKPLANLPWSSPPPPPVKGKGKGEPKGSPRSSKNICFDEAPHLNTSCKKRGCEDAHLDTKDAVLLEGYNRAWSAFEQRG